MRRREFMTLVGGAAVWPVVARAQERPNLLPRIGYLVVGAADDQVAQVRYAVFREALDKLGWSDGRSVRIEQRWGASGEERVRSAVAEMVGLGPRTILSEGTPATQALLRETRSIPIVFVAASDPLSSGLVASMAHPGGNVTGINSIGRQLDGKLLQLLKEAVPTVSRVAVIWDAGFFGPFAHEELTAAAQKLGVQLLQIGRAHV